MRQWFPFYPGDYLRDTQFLTPEEHGCYLLMIMTYYSTGEALPNCRFKLSRIFGISPQKTTKILSTISKFFDEKDGKFFHSKIEREIEKSKANHDVRVNAGRSGGLAKARALALAVPQPQPKEKEKAHSSPKRKSVKTKKFIPPTIEEVREYIEQKGYDIDPVKFVNHYGSANWFRGKTKISNWKMCVGTWVNRNPKQEANYGSDGI